MLAGMKRAYIITEIEYWNDIFRLNQRFMSNFIFRGHGNADWSLKTSLARMVENHHPNYIEKAMPASYEQRMMDEFQWKYPSYEKGHIPESDEAIEWLSLMQHYGSPTRMLDFSYSMYVALFMAIDGSFHDKSAIWALNKHVLNEKLIRKYCTENDTNVVSGDVREKYIYEEATKAINRRFYTKKDDEDSYLYAIRPQLSNERINRQQGLFVIPSSIEIGFEDILKEYYDSGQYGQMRFDDVVRLSVDHSFGQQTVAVLKIEIPKTLKYGLSTLLRQMNITSETMYPGLDGLARSMSCLRDAMGDYKAD